MTERFYNSLMDVLTLVGIPADASSLVAITGPVDPVLRTRYRVAEAGIASFAAAGVAASRLHALKTGRSQEVSVDSREIVVGLRSNGFMQIDGAFPPRERDPMGGFYELGSGRWFMLHCSFEHLRDGAARALGVEPTREAAAAAFKRWSGDATELEDRVFEAGGCGAYVRTPEEWSRTAQASALKQLPLVEILKIGEAPVEPLPPGEKPLSGVRVLDLTRVIAGPSCSRMLAEYGADVLRVTRSDLPDSGYTDIDTGIGKLSTFLDLRIPEQDAQLRELVRSGDVFVQSYRDGALAGRGYAPSDVARLRPGAIYVTLNAWGHGGPLVQRRGYDTVVQSASGMAHVHGTRGKPVLQAVAALDYVSGALMALGTMAALHRRATEGGSWLVRTSLAGSMQWLCSMGLLEEEALHSAPEEFSREAVQSMSTNISSPMGLVTYMRPAVKLSETSLTAVRAPVPLGHDAPEWPERSV